MRAVKVADSAREDLRGIWSYVAQHNPEAANKLIKEITGKFAVLSIHPLMGREQHELLVNLRSFPIRGYVIFYQPSEDGIEVLRVLHGSRDIETIFESFLDSL